MDATSKCGEGAATGGRRQSEIRPPLELVAGRASIDEARTPALGKLHRSDGNRRVDPAIAASKASEPASRVATNVVLKVLDPDSFAVSDRRVGRHQARFT